MGGTKIEFRVCRRGDGRLVIVPILFELPTVLKAGAHLVGSVELHLDDFTPSTVAALGLQGYAEVAGPDADRVRAALPAGTLDPA